MTRSVSPVVHGHDARASVVAGVSGRDWEPRAVVLSEEISASGTKDGAGSSCGKISGGLFVARIATLLILLLSPGKLAAQSLQDWLSNHSIDWNADLLSRSDNIYNLADENDIHRARLWLRPGFEVSSAGSLRFGARGSFALGTDRNQESILRFDNFHSNDVALDRLYVAMEKGGIELRAGKFDMPFQVSEMLWDHDIQPSGAF